MERRNARRLRCAGETESHRNLGDQDGRSVEQEQEGIRHVRHFELRDGQRRVDRENEQRRVKAVKRQVVVARLADQDDADGNKKHADKGIENAAIHMAELRPGQDDDAGETGDNRAGPVITDRFLEKQG